MSSLIINALIISSFILCVLSEPYRLPAGAEEVVGKKIKETFKCSDVSDGYYADVDNEYSINYYYF
jgi:hypothetical protein